MIIVALERAERLTKTAATAVGPNPVFERWFGVYSKQNAEKVRRNLKSIVSAIRTGKMDVACVTDGVGLCDPETYAFVDPDVPYEVKLCANFFTMDTMKDLTDESVHAGHGTRAGTFVHEISHFTMTAGTDDVCYSREDCMEMALDAPQDAVNNADSYQYFVEDVTYFGVAGGG